MRMISIIFLCFLFAVPAFAADDVKPFTEMTLIELKTVDTKALSKADKKLYRGALRAAKKVEKARQKEEKKRAAEARKAEKASIRAEKKRARAEAKRLKKEAKTLAKKNKKTLKRIALMEEIYQKTTASKDDFEGYIEFVSPRHPKAFASFLGGRASRDYRMRAFFFPNRGELTIQILVSETIITEKINAETVSSLDTSPEKFATRHEIWKDYSRATMRGAKQLELVKISKTFYSCEFSLCRFRELVGIKFNYPLLESVTQNLKYLDIKIAGRKYYYIVSIPPEFIAGFIKKMARYVDVEGKYAALALKIENTLKKQLATMP